jgi:hypothetical protein
MKVQTYSCTMENVSPNKSCHTNHHNVELSQKEFDHCKGLCQHEHCKAQYGKKAKLIPIEGTERELPNNIPEVGQVWRNYERPDVYIIIHAVSKDRSSVFVTGNNECYASSGIATINNLHRRYVLDPNW